MNMKIQDIYEQYNIMPSLQLHMLRVTSVGKIISESFQDEVNANVILTACLLHDMRGEPKKVVSLEDRLKDGRDRFKQNKKHFIEDEEFFQEMASYLSKMESQIFDKSRITPTDITDTNVQQYLNSLRNFDISVQ